MSGIIADVRMGDAALLELTARYDRLDAGSVAEFAVGRDEIDAALDGLTRLFVIAGNGGIAHTQLPRAPAAAGFRI